MLKRNLITDRRFLNYLWSFMEGCRVNENLHFLIYGVQKQFLKGLGLPKSTRTPLPPAPRPLTKITSPRGVPKSQQSVPIPPPIPKGGGGGYFHPIQSN